MQLLKNVYLVSGQPYGYHPNAYAIRGERGVILVDCGTNAEEFAMIRSNLAYWGLADLKVSALLLTHAHFDHSANAHLLKDEGALIVAGPGDADAVEKGDYRTIHYCYGEPFVPCRVDVTARDGQELELDGLVFSVTHVPGHSMGSLVFSLVQEGRIILFTGDTILTGPDGVGATLGFTGGYDFSKEHYLRSLEKLSRLPADLVLTGHGQPCLRAGYRVLQLGFRTALAELR